jgi:FMN reductase
MVSVLSRTRRIVAVSGSPTQPSRTSVLVTEVAAAFAAAIDADVSTIELGPLLAELGAGPARTDLGPNARAALDLVEDADLLVVGSPAFRATYTGLFKLFFDHIGQYALVDKPVVLTATGGSDRHALLVEHQMRPLFGFFQSLTLPIGIYAQPGDFERYELASPELRRRIDGGVRRTLPLLASHLGLVAADGVRQEFTRPDVF